MVIRLIAIAAATLTISTCVAMAETGGNVYRDPLTPPKVNSAGSSGATMRHELPMRAIVNGHHVQPRRDLLDALGYSDLSPQAAEEVDRLNWQLLHKTSLQTECALEMTRHAAGCRGRFVQGEPQGRGRNGQPWCAGWGPIFETWPWLRAGSESEIDFTHRRRGTEMRGYIVGRVQQPQERDHEDHASCRSSSISLGVGSAYADSGDRRVANTQFTELPGVIAQAPVQNAPAVATAQSERSPDLAAIASDGSELQCCSLRLLSPADPLTRLLMKADGVSEAYLDALVQKIAKQRG